MTTVGISEAKRRLSTLLDRAAKGEEIIISKRAQPLARLVAVAAPKPPRKPAGALKIAWIAEDFDAPLPPDVLKLFGIDP